MQPRIYVDIDDVLCETGKAYPNLLETHFGKSATFASMHAFDLGVSFSLKPDELQRLLALAHEDDVLKQLRAVPGARKGLDQFRSMGYDIAIVTGRPPSTEEATRWWLQKQRMPHQQLIFVDKYGRADPDAFDDRVVTLEGLRGMTFSYAVEDSSGTWLSFLRSAWEYQLAFWTAPGTSRIGIGFSARRWTCSAVPTGLRSISTS